jgi:hypothetical protein
MSHQIHRLAAVVTSGVSHRDRGKLPELRSLLILLLSTRQSRRHPARLGCRLNAGGVEWAERHECRSAACPRSVACARPAKVAIGVVCDICARHDRSHAPRGNAVHDAARHSGRRASWTGFPRGAWERSIPVGDAGGRWYGPRFGRWRWVWWLICSLIHRLAAVVTSGVSHRDRGKLPELRSLLILLLSTRQSRRHPSRLGCRLNAGGVEWVERHGCRESRRSAMDGRSAAGPRSVACARPAKSQLVSFSLSRRDRSNAPRGNAAHDAPRHSGRRASRTAFPRGA